MDDRLERAPVGVLTVTDAGTVQDANGVAESLLTEDAKLGGDHIRAVFPHSVDEQVATAFEDGSPTVRRSFDEYYPELEQWLAVTIAPADGGATIYLQDVTERERIRGRNNDFRAELDRMAVTDNLVSEILSALVDASTREEIAETICQQLGTTDLYEFAWVGEREIGDDDIVVRASSGETDQMLSPIRDALGTEGTSPEEKAIQTGELQVVQPLAEEPTLLDTVRQSAFACGLQSLLAIPLRYGSSVYGVVGVYTTDQKGFTERERESFRTVGEMAGFAVNAARHRSLLLSDRIVELTLEISSESSPLAAATAVLDATVSLDGVVPRQDESVICYLVIDGVDPDRAADVVDEYAEINGARVVNRTELTGVLEVAVDEETPLGLLMGRGATIESAEYADGSGRLTCEFPPQENVRRIADAVSQQYEGEVLAKRQVERDATTPTEFRAELRDRLTERQETALRTAFFADYFESPRESSAEDVAAALDITGPTLLYHLRAGQRKLLESFFDSKAGSDDRP